MATLRGWEEDNSTDPAQDLFRDYFLHDFCKGFSRQDLQDEVELAYHAKRVSLPWYVHTWSICSPAR